MPERQALLEAAAKLQVATEDLGRKFEAVDLFAHETAAAHKRTRDLTYWLILGLVTQLVIIAVLAWTNNKANDANSKSTRNQEYQVASCEAANETRRAQMQLWTDNAALIRQGGGEGAKIFADKLLTNAAKAFAQRDCSQVPQGRVVK